MVGIGSVFFSLASPSVNQYHGCMVSRHELPLLDSEIRDFLLAFAHRVPILLTYDANRMLYLDVDPIEAITKVCDELCLLMKESHFNVTAEHREGLLRFLECCVTEIRDVYPEKVHPEAFLPMNGYFTGEELQLMTTHGRHLKSSIFEMIELFRKGEADEVHIIEYPTAMFIKHLGDAGAREMLTPSFQMAIKELAMLAVFSFLVMDQIVPFGS